MVNQSHESRYCSNPYCEKGLPVELPECHFEKEQLKPEYRRLNIEGAFISPNGWLYCNVRCYCNFNDD